VVERRADIAGQSVFWRKERAAMIETILKDREEEGVSSKAPYLSYSRINRYLHCPEQYRLYYIENLRPKVPAASLVFGKIIHQALALLFRSGADPVQHFLEQWKLAGEVELDYGSKESWEKLQTCGKALLEKFMQEELRKLENVRAAEKVFELNITTLDLPLIGVIDLVADLDEKPTVVDFKTAASAYQKHEVALSDQLTAYQLAEPDACQSALCVLVKTKEPRIEWYLSNRTGTHLVEFLNKAQLVSHEISAGHFYKRPGKWCSYCDFLPVCLGDQQKTKETLVQIR
jgi:RecB family exonuclease